MSTEIERDFDAMWQELAPIGRNPQTGGYNRFAWTAEDRHLREWFQHHAQKRSLDIHEDRAGNLWAWTQDPDAALRRGVRGIATGSHLDSVPEGGAFDGPLGVVSAFLALDDMRRQGQEGSRPLAISLTSDEEGARFGVACVGTRVATGILGPDKALDLQDAAGTTLAEALIQAGRNPDDYGSDPEACQRMGSFVELHVEQGRALIDTGCPVGVAKSIWPHGRWRIDLPGTANHAGTTRLVDRDDPMLSLAALITATRTAAERHEALATIGKLRVNPNAVNAIAELVQAWLDCRASRVESVEDVLAELRNHGFSPRQESWTPVVTFDQDLAERMVQALEPHSPVVRLGTGAGHDAGVFSEAGYPSGMLFVRNPTGVSHSPVEFAEISDCVAGVQALATVLAALTSSDSDETGEVG